MAELGDDVQHRRRRPSSFSNRNECSRGFPLWLSRDFSQFFRFKLKNFNQLNVIIFGRDICERAAAAGGAATAAAAASAVVCAHV